MQTILIAGCGNIGSRHLQSLKLTKLPLHIYAYDPFDASLQKAKNIWESTNGTAHEISFVNDLNALPNTIFVCIIATNSADRLNVFEFIATNFTVKHFILEKFLFPKIEEYQRAQNTIDQITSTVFVNCPRRVFKPYVLLKEELINSKISSIELTGKNWGLCSNTIHFIDLFHFLSGKLPLSAMFDLNHTQLVPSKREGYLEAFGQINCIFENFIAKISCNDGLFDGIEIFIQTQNNKFKLEEKNNRILIYKDDLPMFDDKILFQSELSASYIENLNSNTDTGLTNFSDSRKMHEVFLSAVKELVEKLNYTQEWKIS